MSKNFVCLFFCSLLLICLFCYFSLLCCYLLLILPCGQAGWFCAQTLVFHQCSLLVVVISEFNLLIPYLPWFSPCTPVSSYMLKIRPLPIYSVQLFWFHFVIVSAGHLLECCSIPQQYLEHSNDWICRMLQDPSSSSSSPSSPPSFADIVDWQNQDKSSSWLVGLSILFSLLGRHCNLTKALKPSWQTLSLVNIVKDRSVE